MDNNKKRKLEEGGDNEDEIKRNNLRCREIDIKVIVGGEKQDTNTTEKKVFWHYSQILAFHSRYVDALLSAPLAAAVTVASRNTDNKNAGGNKESNNINDNNDVTSINTTEISFPDITPPQWERMVNFVTDPVASRTMTVKDAMELVSLYDKYDFHTGIKLCDEILSSMFYCQPKDMNRNEFRDHNNNLELFFMFYSDVGYFKDHMDDFDLLDRFVEVIVLSHEKNLKKTLVNGMKWMEYLFSDEDTPESLIFTVDHIRKLMIVVASHKDNPDLGSCNVQNAIENRLSKYDLDILNPMFPEFFVSQIQLIVTRNTTLQLVNQVKISNCTRIAGTYNADDEENWNIDGTSIYSKKHFNDPWSCINLKRNEIGDWVIEGHVGFEEDMILFICKGSRCKTLPPKKGWKKIDSENNMNGQHDLPILSYYYMNHTGNAREIKI